MAYLKPPWFVSKVFNKVALATGASGTRRLEVPRRNGGEQTVPVIPVDHDGDRYIVSTRGESQWVRNLRAAGRCRIKDEEYGAEEVPADARGEIIAAYRAKAGRTATAYWKQLPADADHPTFRLTEV